MEKKALASAAPPSAVPTEPTIRPAQSSDAGDPTAESCHRIIPKVAGPFLNPFDGHTLAHQHRASPSMDSLNLNTMTSHLRIQQTYTSPQDSNSATANRSIDDFRSIIDDLTIQNQRLKERLQQYESSVAQTPALANERLFEVKVHGLRTKKKQELIETLKAFANRDDVRQEIEAAQRSEQNQAGRKSSSSRSAQPSANSGTQSGLHDSAYASVSAPKSNPSSTDRKQSSYGGRRKLSFVDETQPPPGTPVGLLPKITPFRTDREKKVMVVKRLEHLFNGESAKRGKAHYRAALHDTGLVAVSAADTDQLMEGTRESHIFDDNNDPHHEFNISSTDESKAASPKADQASPTDSDQRATRPLDVDPDRVQVPGENISYIRHLGMSPRIATEELLSEAGDDGWIYLNILINLAQLHILNVTPDFVRSAITEVSKKFELSPDRQKVRWRGAAQITKLASDSDVDRTKRDATTDSSDGPEHMTGKKRKTINTSSRSGGGSEQVRALGQSASDSNTWSGAGGYRRKTIGLDYKPVIIKPRRMQDEMAGEDGESSYLPRSVVPGGGMGSAPFTMGSEMDANSNDATHRAEAGSIVFFSNASFYIDFSGDSSDVLAELQAQRGRYWDYRRKRYAPLGSESTKNTQSSKRSSSSSRMRSRPFKEYSKVGENFLQEDRSKTPDVLDSDCENSDFGFSIQQSLGDLSMTDSTLPPVPMEASGLGGITPEDRFIITVETAYYQMNAEARKRIQAQLKEAIDLDRRVAKLIRRIEEAKLGTTQPVSLNATPRGPKQCPLIHHKVLSEKLYKLMPSEIPPSAQFFCDLDSDSDGTSNYGSEDLELSNLKDAKPEHEKHAVVVSDDADGDWDEEDEDEDSEIDFLGEQRLIDPERVAEEERLWERVKERERERTGKGEGDGGDRDTVMADRDSVKVGESSGSESDEEDEGEDDDDEEMDEDEDEDESESDGDELRAFEKFKRGE